MFYLHKILERSELESFIEDLTLKMKGLGYEMILDNISEIVVECKKSVKNHESSNRDHPKDFAVDGVLYYAKYLKKEFNVIAVAVSGTTSQNIKVDAFHWIKGADEFLSLERTRDIILESLNYLKHIKGEDFQKDYSLELPYQINRSKVFHWCNY